MADLFEKILLPVASRDDARATAAALSKYEPDEIVAVHVIEKGGGTIDKAGVEQRELEAEEIFEALQESLGHAVETKITYGTDVAEAIFEAAHGIDASSIVITPRGGSRWIRLLTGDVALSLITESDLPVVVLPDDEDLDIESQGDSDR
jgi:nucleotide-binding universal stress UspA family protein